MAERESVDFNKLGAQLNALGHPVALKIIAVLNDNQEVLQKPEAEDNQPSQPEE